MITTDNEIVIFGEHDEATMNQIRMCQETLGIRSVLCADGHKGYSAPIGGVTAYIDNISVSGVGYDIACGNMAIKTDATWDDIKKRLPQIADTIESQISFGVGRNSKEDVDHELFDADEWSIPVLRDFKDKARKQLGTCGSGNHYADVFVDENGIVWVGVHFGSRGLGHTIATNALLVAGAKDGMDEPPCVLSVKSDLGAAYLKCMELAGRYAYAGREYVARYIVNKILKANIVEEIHNHHNYCWKETHDGVEYYVVRKGSTPAFPGQRGFVGGSMGDMSVIIEGVDSELSRSALYSTVHGAGRVMSRTQAAGKKKWLYNERLKKKVPTRVTEGLVNEDSMRQKIKNAGIELRGAGADEAPQVYKNLASVLDHHSGTIEILYTLQPKIVVMAGEETYDPYKD